MSKNTKNTNKMLLSSTLMFSLSFLLFISVTIAWFGFVNKVGDLNIVVANPEVSGDLYYNDPVEGWIGSSTETQESSFMYENVLPNQYFEYKLIIRNTGSVDGLVKVALSEFTCTEGKGDKCVSDRMQIKNMSVYKGELDESGSEPTYVNGDQVVESPSVMTLNGSDKYLAAATNDELVILTYDLLAKNEVIILYFIVWFNPEFAYSASGPVEEADSNAYINSNVRISKVKISLDQIQSEYPSWGD